MYTDTTITRISPSPAVTTRPEDLAAEVDDVARAADDLVLQRLQRGLALALDLDVDALAIEVGLQVGEPVVGVVDDPRHVVAELLRLVGDRVGQQHADADRRDQQAEVDDDDRQAARQTGARLQERHDRVEDQRDDAGDREGQQHDARRLGDEVQRDDEQRQRDELDPPRDDDLSGGGGVRRAGPGGGSRQRVVPCPVRVSVGGRCSSPPSARVCDVPAAPSILFVGDVVGGLGRRTLLGLLPALRERLRARLRRRQRREHRRRPGHHAEARRRALRRRRRRDHARQPHLPARARSAPTSTPASRSCGPPTT